MRAAFPDAMNIRQATTNDAEAMLEIYRPVVETTAISFEYVPPTAEEFAERVSTALERHTWLLAENDRGIIGYSYATVHRSREAYRLAAETSVYVRPDCQGQGLGKALYDALFEALAELGFHSAFAGIALPNDASIALHKACGFTEIGTFKEIGFKHDQWHDVSWWQRRV